MKGVIWHLVLKKQAGLWTAGDLIALKFSESEKLSCIMYFIFM